MITVTETAKQKFLEAAEAEGRQGQGLRLAVGRGGTAHPEFSLNFVAAEQQAEDDVVVDLGPFRLHMDPQSARLLEDATVDFVETPAGSGFKIDAPKAGIPTPSGPLADAVRKVLDERINPGVAGHGGQVSLVAVEQGVAYLRFGGGCQGCGMANVTLKEGVEKILLQEVSGLKRVTDVTDHAAGTNPYYDSRR